jgi:hypothetical protein
MKRKTSMKTINGKKKTKNKIKLNETKRKT